MVSSGPHFHKLEIKRRKTQINRQWIKTVFVASKLFQEPCEKYILLKYHCLDKSKGRPNIPITAAC